MKKSKKQAILETILEIIDTGLNGKTKWNKKENQQLQMYSRDLLDLEKKMSQTKGGKNKAKEEEYQKASQRIFNHIALLALQKATLKENELKEKLKNKLIGLLREGLKILLAALLS